MKTLITLILSIFIASVCFSQPIPPDSLYLGLPRPGDSAVIFAPGLISIAGRKESAVTISPDGKSIIYSIEFYPSPGNPYTMHIEYKNNKWQPPENTSFTSGRKTNEPFFAFNGNRIYMSANLTLNQVGTMDLAYVTRNDTVWSQPVSMGTPPNTTSDQYHPCIVADTSVYFSSSAGLITCSRYHNGAYLPRVTIPYPVNYANTTQTWGDPYVSPDESYMIFKSTRPGGFGGNDLYISYKKQNGKWTNPKNLGNKINTQYDERAGDVTPDGNYMTFGSNDDMYWVSTGFVNRLRQTNFIPYLMYQIPNKTDSLGHVISFTIPDSTFVDDDGNNTLTYSAALKNGNPLPSWLQFNPSTRTFSGLPVSPETDSIRVTVTDTANATANCVFVLKIENHTSIRQLNGGLNDYKLFQNYPNPFNPSTTIKFSLPKSEFVSLIIYDVLGKEVENVFSGLLKAGSYNAEFNAANIPSGIYFYSLKSNSFSDRKKMVVLK
ncbi:MAG: putative Ig domain-containing protein [Bacteroidetes bacterium]|nr:putative Ig domain-containing protein [Bacteroidota bacterium]